VVRPSPKKGKRKKERTINDVNDIALPTSTVMIFIRSVYRTVEMQQGYGGALMKNQGTFLVFEGVLVIIATTALLVFHPGFSYAYMRDLRRKLGEVTEGTSLSELNENGRTAAGGVEIGT
jgi:hypothetical protein